jgi:hypothetical protein
MSDLDDSFAKLLGRQPSDTERQNLYRVRDALGLKNNDAIWLVLMALQHYQTKYEEYPEKIAQAADKTLTNLKQTADATMKASAEQTKADLAKAVAEVAKKVADSTAHKQRAQWITLSVLIVTALMSGIFYYVHDTAYRAGYNNGYGTGYNEAKDEKAAAAWANTPAGQLAYRFAQTGSLNSLAKCDRPGWYVEKGVCYVKPASDGTYGWRLP